MIKINNNDSKDKPTLVSNNDKGLEVVRVSKSYNNRPVIREVSFNIKKGEAVGLLGPNGSGKTTLFYSIIGLIRPNTGNIILNGFKSVWQIFLKYGLVKDFVTYTLD